MTFVLFTSVMMFVLFFVLNKWIFYVFVGLFAYGAAVAAGVCMHTFVATFRPTWMRPTLPSKWAGIKITVVDVVIGALAVTAAVVWVTFRYVGSPLPHASQRQQYELNPSSIHSVQISTCSEVDDICGQVLTINVSSSCNCSCTVAAGAQD
jgi:Signal peptide peptidase